MRCRTGIAPPLSTQAFRNAQEPRLRSAHILLPRRPKSLRSGKPPFLGSEDEFFYHTGISGPAVRRWNPDERQLAEIEDSGLIPCGCRKAVENGGTVQRLILRPHPYPILAVLGM